MTVSLGNCPTIYVGLFQDVRFEVHKITFYSKFGYNSRVSSRNYD